ncbi:MAG: phospholipase D-like domain-containing protein [Ignavibacteriaceae bacterium]|jgi:phosphatidylserine/phosphatidylglycerophosphate/cardiolipin synthase-like enzyme|nr:phospholipase D-like domain-containing protein [Ignavibacteriaceae bacterium]
MKHIKSLFLALILISSAFSQPIIINEIYNSSSSDEWVELLVVQDSLDLRNWDIRDFSSTGSPQAPLAFTSNALWSNLRKGTIIIIARSENTFSEDLDPSDYLLIVKSSNAIYLSGNPFSIAGTSDAVQLRNSSQVHQFGVSWGANNAGSIPNPKVHFSGASSSGTSITFIQDDVSKLTNTANWTINGSSSMGQGNSAANIAWINLLRASLEGSGTATLLPQIAIGDSVIDLNFTYKKNPLYSINSLRIIIPEDFQWSQSASDINYTDFTSTLSVSGDTIFFSNINFISDTVTIIVNEVTSPHYTGRYRIKFQSGVNLVLADVSPLPSLLVYGAPIPIAEAKVNDNNGIGLRLGDLVTLRGVVTVSNQFGGPSYIQDNTGGISVFGAGFSGAVQIGDEVLVTGTVAQFNGLNQIENPTLHSIISSGNTVEPLITTSSTLSGDGINGVENYEGRLIRVNGVVVSELNGSSVSNWAYKNYRLTGSSPSDTVQIRIDNDTQIIGLVAPAGKFDVIGVLSQYKPSLPFIGGYQVMPRVPEDILSNGPIIDKYPEETDLTSNSISLEWTTINPGTSRIRYGVTANYELGIVELDNVLRTNHSLTVDELEVATIYHLQVFSVANGDTSFSSDIVSSTTSALPTTGGIQVYFNKTVNTLVSSGIDANSNANFQNILIDRINKAKRSIDAALYSLSGTVGANIAAALLNAKNRGVKIRVIGEYDNRTTAPWNTLINNGIPYINDRFGNNDGSGIHHNKFFIIDYRGGAADSIWVITGSWNPTDPGTNDDRQNLIIIQDVALAGAYTLEFNEEWGSDTDTPNAANSRFGPRKLNNTPHNFVIGGNKVQLYFSPSDGTTAKIGRTLGKADKSINVALLSFTRRDLADSIIAIKNKGSKTRVILSNNTDTGSQYFYMQSAGVDIRLKGFTTGLLHHKYAVIDAEPFGYNASVITGSHNWSSSAENVNDENTLIILDDQVANFYLQEFAARYYEAGGQDSLVTSVDEESETIPVQFGLYQNYPNPFNPVTSIRFDMPFTQKVELSVYDVLGRKVKELFNNVVNAGQYSVEFNASGLASGVYIYRIKSDSFTDSKKLLLLK